MECRITANKLIKELLENIMTKHLTLPQLKKYDVTQKVIQMLSDAESRAILFSMIRVGKTASELANKHKIPLSSVYKKISDLEELTLIKVDSWQISEKGRKFKVYKSRIKHAEINIKKPDPVLILTPNK